MAVVKIGDVSEEASNKIKENTVALTISRAIFDF